MYVSARYHLDRNIGPNVMKAKGESELLKRAPRGLKLQQITEIAHEEAVPRSVEDTSAKIFDGEMVTKVYKKVKTAFKPQLRIFGDSEVEKLLVALKYRWTGSTIAGLAENDVPLRVREDQNRGVGCEYNKG